MKGRRGWGERRNEKEMKKRKGMNLYKVKEHTYLKGRERVSKERKQAKEGRKTGKIKTLMPEGSSKISKEKFVKVKEKTSEQRTGEMEGGCSRKEQVSGSFEHSFPGILYDETRHDR
jgi:hypothetical protein